jgi:hypothetical protein
MDLFRQLLPPVVLLERRPRNWHRVQSFADDAAQVDGFLHRYSQANKWSESAMALRTFGERLGDEHQRLEAIENKNRSVLAAAAVLVAFVSFSANTLFWGADRDWFIAHEDLARFCRIAAATGILFLAFAVLLSLSAGRIGVRWYVDPIDLEKALSLVEKESQGNHDVLTAAVAMHFKDRMAVATEAKLYVLEAAINCLRNGLWLVVLALIAVVLGRF